MDFEKVKEIIVDSLSCDESQVTMEASLKDDLEADSLDAVELIMQIEEEFEVEIPDEVASNMKTVMKFNHLFKVFKIIKMLKKFN